MYVPEDKLSDIAQVKRLLEYTSLIPGFTEEIRSNPKEVIKKYGFKLDPVDLSFKDRTKENQFRSEALYPGSRAEEYSKFVNSKIDMRDGMTAGNVPDNKAMKKWRARQLGRCQVELGAKSQGLIHAPFTLELSDGCSVGCEFCGLNAGCLKSVFRYTEENAKLFREVLTVAKDIIGEKAAGNGTMYCASEPLDNPDYEKFLADYREIFHKIPQITTAVATRDIERTRRLVSEIKNEDNIIYRFSVLSLDTAKKIFESFTPEELIYVELLPQYNEAPGNGFVNAGRQGDNSDEYGDTISCMSGFRVNMCRKELILVTPTWSSREHPTGEYILDKAYFENGEELREHMLSMIKKHMMNIIPPNEGIKLRQNVRFEDAGDKKLKLIFKEQMEMILTCNEAFDLYYSVLNKLTEGYKTRHEIITELLAENKKTLMDAQSIAYVINKFWGLGLVQTQSGII